MPISFDAFTGRLEGLVGRLDPGVAERALAEGATAARTRIGAMAGEQGLMMFGAQDHGRLFALRGQAMKAKRYHVGNASPTPGRPEDSDREDRSGFREASRSRQRRPQ